MDLRSQADLKLAGSYLCLQLTDARLGVCELCLQTQSITNAMDLDAVPSHNHRQLWEGARGGGHVVLFSCNVIKVLIFLLIPYTTKAMM